MITLTNEQKAELYRHTRVDHVRGTVGGVAFDDSNIISMHYSNRCSSTDDISFGLAYVGQINVTFCNIPVSRKNWKAGKKIKIEWGFDYTDENDEPATFWAGLGVFYIASAEWTDTGINVVANDVISKFDKAFGGIQTNASTIGEFAAFACEQCGVDFALSAAQARALPNGMTVLPFSDENDVKTWRDFIAWLACCAGGFATATRDGKMIIKSFADSAVVDSWGTGVRIAGSVFSDFDTAYDGVSVTLIKYNQNQIILGDDIHGSGIYINLGANPFMQGNFTVAEVLADLANEIEWAPFKTSLLSNAVYDLGDLITCTNGVAGDDPLTCCIMSIDWEFKALTNYQGYGADPNLKDGKSKTDKAIGVLQSQATADKINFVKFVNSSGFTIEDELTEIADIRFAVTHTTDVEIWTELKLQATNPADLTLFYYLDDELIASYTPSEEWDNGGFDVWIDEENTALCFKKRNGDSTSVHTSNFHYHLTDVNSDTYHRWTVKAIANTGTVTIQPGDEHAILWAQGMAGEDEWIGLIEAHDSIPFLDFGVLDLFGTLSDDATLSIIGPTVPENIITETGDYIITETGDNITTE